VVLAIRPNRCPKASGRMAVTAQTTLSSASIRFHERRVVNPQTAPSDASARLPSLSAVGAVADAEFAVSHRDQKKCTRVSVILPVWNESRVADYAAAAVLEFARRNPEFEFVFVDDGSTDGTATILEGAVNEAGRSNVAVASAGTHRGKGAAIKFALPRCTGDYVCFTDGDLAYTLDHVQLLERALNSHEVVIGSRFLVGPLGTSAPPLRAAMSWSFNRFVRLVLGVRWRDTQAGLKGFRTPVARHIFAMQRIGGLGFDVELLFLARRFGYSVTEIPARVNPDHTYKTSKSSLLKSSIRMMFDVLAVRWNAIAGRY
jgi:dolichyl-phosphate beta-glucosyltransferase